VHVVDSIGAGDIFHAGFIYGLLRDWPIQRQLDFACAAAALNCMAVGARGGIQPVERIEKLVAPGYGKVWLFNFRVTPYQPRPLPNAAATTATAGTIF
jgi:hypothetical protein